MARVLERGIRPWRGVTPIVADLLLTVVVTALSLAALVGPSDQSRAPITWPAIALTLLGARPLLARRHQPLDEPGETMRYAVALHVLMSQAEMELWERFADRWRLEIDDAVHAAALSGLQDQLAHDGDEVDAHVAGACERELRARLGLKAV